MMLLWDWSIMSHIQHLYLQARHLTTKELSDPHLSKCNAIKIAEYHAMDLPLNKEPTWIWENMEK